MKSKQLILALLIWCLLTQQAQAYFVFTGGPVLDYTDKVFNTIKATQAKLKSAETVKKTVALLEKVAALYAMYDNAQDLYKSIGSAVKSVDQLKKRMGSVSSKWLTAPTSFADANKMLRRWGVEPAETGPIAELNDTLFGEGSAGKALQDMSKDTRKVVRETPRALSRDRFIRNTVKGVKASQGGTSLTVKDANGSELGDRSLTLHEETNILSMSVGESVGANMVSNEAHRRAREVQHDSINSVLESYAAGDDASQMSLAMEKNELMAQRATIQLNMAQQNSDQALVKTRQMELELAEVEAKRKLKQSEQLTRAALKDL